MSLYDQIIAAYPELTDSTAFADNQIVLQNDGDDLGDWLVKWNYEKPLPKGIKIGK